MIKEMLSYAFMQRALIVGILISLCAALLGVSLVLKRYAMIGDGLSHVGFGALSVATALGQPPLAVSIPVVMAAAFFLLRLSESKKLKGDSAIALISTGSLAVGVTVLSFSKGANFDLSGYMFGSILAVTEADVILSVITASAVVILFAVFYNRLFACTFDENYARASGINAGFYNILLAMMTAATVVVGMRLTGALLISALIIFPPITAMRVAKSFKAAVIYSAVLSVVCFIIGVTASYALSTPTGASVVIVDIIVFAAFTLYAKLKAAIKKP